jgi:Spy/CpxP family protein refolding chaperone
MKRTALTAIAVVALAALMWAQPGPGAAAGGPMGRAGMPMMDKTDQTATTGRGGPMDMMANMPDMTPEQMEKCDAMRVAQMKTVLPIRTDIQVAEIELDALWRADNIDAKKIIAKVNEIGGLRQKLELAMVNHRIDMYNLMTPDQRKAMKKMGMGPGMKGKGMGRKMRGMGRGMKSMGQGGPMGQMNSQGCPDCMMH